MISWFEVLDAKLHYSLKLINSLPFYLFTYPCSSAGRVILSRTQTNLCNAAIRLFRKQ